MSQSREKQLEAALAFVLILLIIGLATHYRPFIFYTIAIGFSLGTFPFLLRYFYMAWSSLLKAINFVASGILLSIIFLALIIPLSFFVKKSKKRTIISEKGNRTSLFTDRDCIFTGKDLENPW